MPLTGPSSYVPTINDFLAHWAQVNIALGAANPLVLGDGTTLAALTSHRDSLQKLSLKIQGKLNDIEISRAGLDISKDALLERLRQFNRKVRGFLSHTAYVSALPEVPPPRSSVATLVQSLDDMRTLWEKIDLATIPDFTGPLMLLDGYAVATFVTELAALKTQSAGWQNANQEAKLERERRNELQDKVQPVLRDYRAAVLGTFADTDALAVSLPRLSPLPGSTPDRVQASGQWDATLQTAKLSWSASNDPHLAEYSIRFVAGPSYATDDESVIGTVPSSSPREFQTLSGLLVPGSTASFKVYTVLSTGNESGSNPVTISRP